MDDTVLTYMIYVDEENNKPSVTIKITGLDYKEDAEYYFMVKPGITGLWQVSGRSETDYPNRVSIDKWYVINWSIWLDIVILLKTVKVVLFKEGAY